MRKLTDLDARLIGYARPQSGEGVSFTCPVCGPRHSITAFFKNPVDGGAPAPADLALWTREGDALEQLSIDPSIKFPCFHGWVNEGKVFEMREAPIMVMCKCTGRPQLVALSPLQTLKICGEAIAKAKELLGAR
jgi:hypothetical protein